ncbi:hypothetical protein [Evtepia sp.]|uniref:hypothetical protein n=1 Tax=Evtepia sp. TaxID=2773933 RepID=UPI002E7982FA|nr:hypothetical protein [Evtepia sp.]MEE0747198.1 hypothetical protein [Evtepia sp.]
MTVRPIDANIAMKKIREYMEDFPNASTRLATCRSILSMLEDENQIPTLTPPNEPLTVKQLQKMVGEPVYDYLGQEWYVIQEYYGHELTMTDGTRFFDDDEIDGVDKRFYRRPPEGEGNV